MVAGGSDLAGDVLLIQLQLHALLCKLPLQMCHLQVRGMSPPAAVSDAPVASPRLASVLRLGPSARACSGQVGSQRVRVGRGRLAGSSGTFDVRALSFSRAPSSFADSADACGSHRHRCRIHSRAVSAKAMPAHHRHTRSDLAARNAPRPSRRNAPCLTSRVRVRDHSACGLSARRRIDHLGERVFELRRTRCRRRRRVLKPSLPAHGTIGRLSRIRPRSISSRRQRTAKA